MKTLCALGVLLFSQFAAADLLDAIRAYENKDYPQASRQFAALLPLANEQAAFNLGAMAYNGEGQARDKVKALAYFDFAAQRDHNEAKTLTAQLKSTLSAQEQQQAAQLTLQLQQQVKIAPKVGQPGAILSDFKERNAIKRVEPVYPKEAAIRGVFGSVTMRLLINEQGDVEAVDVLNAYPKGLFEREAVRALKRWKYEPGDSKYIGRVILSFQIGDIDPRRVQRIFDEHKLWEYSVLGSPVHQNALANILDLARSQSMFTQFIDSTLPPAIGPLGADFVKQGKVVSDELQLPAGFQEHTFVTLDDQGVVVSVHDNNTAAQTRIAALLVGKRLSRDQVAAGFYKLENQFANKPPRLLTAQRIPQTYSDEFWLEQAARGGNLEAQRALAALQADWEMYLLEQQDPVVQSWAGTRLILDGQKAEGEKLLDAAIAKGHTTAKELKAVL